MVERNKYGADIFIDSYWLKFNGLHFIFKVQGSVSRAIHFASWTWSKPPSSERLAERKKSKEFVFEDITWTGRPLISSASRSNPGASS